MSKAYNHQDTSYKAIKNLSGSEQDKINFMINDDALKLLIRII